MSYSKHVWRGALRALGGALANMAALPAPHASVGGLSSQTFNIIQRVCLEVASALNREEMTRGAGSLIDRFSGVWEARCWRGAGGEGGSWCPGQMLLIPAIQQREACACFCQDDGAEVFVSAGWHQRCVCFSSSIRSDSSETLTNDRVVEEIPAVPTSLARVRRLPPSTALLESKHSAAK